MARRRKRKGSGALRRVSAGGKRTLAAIRKNDSGQKLMEAGAIVGGGAIAGQVVKQPWFKDKEGNARPHLLNYGAGITAAVAIASGKAKSKSARTLAAVGIGMLGGQIAFKSRDEWDFMPKND